MYGDWTFSRTWLTHIGIYDHTSNGRTEQRTGYQFRQASFCHLEFELWRLVEGSGAEGDMSLLQFPHNLIR